MADGQQPYNADDYEIGDRFTAVCTYWREQNGQLCDGLYHHSQLLQVRSTAPASQ